MKKLEGVILKMPEHLGYGVGPFLELWQTDPVGALENRLMGDRDSYSGDYLNRQIEGGVLDRDNVEEVFMYWLSGDVDTPREKFNITTFETVVWLGQFRKMQRVLCYLVNHFDHFIRVAEPHFRQHVRRSLMLMAPSAENYALVWSVVRRYLEESSPFDLGLFEHVFTHPKVNASRCVAEGFLTGTCKHVRIIRRKNPEQADDLVRSLEFALLSFFGWDFKNGGDFRKASARAKRWLLAQNAYVSFPIR